LILFGLVLMVLVRLVWMQLRHYPLSIDPRTKISLDMISGRYDGECRGSRHLLRTFFEAGDGGFTEKSRTTGAVLSWIAAPGSVFMGVAACMSDLPPEVFFVKWNQWLLIATVVGAAFLVRFATSSWTAAAVAATVLLSRGRFLSDIGLASSKSLLQCLITLWLAAGSHFFRSGSWVVAVFGCICLMIASCFDGVMLVILLALPTFLLLGFSLRKRLAKPMIRRFRGQPGDLIEIPGQGDQGKANGSLLRRMGQTARWVLGTEVPSLMRLRTQRPDYRQGGVFFTLKVPFLLWASYRRRWLSIILWGAAAFCSGIVGLALVKWGVLGSDWTHLRELPAGEWREGAWKVLHVPWLRGWLAAGWHFWDTHYTLSLAVLVVCALISPARGLPAYWETVWLALIALVLLALASFCGDVLDALLFSSPLVAQETISRVFGVSQLPPREFFSWMEPVVLSLAVAGIYNLIEVLDSRSSTNLSTLKDTRTLRR
jgi:hypothetical protein